MAEIRLMKIMRNVASQLPGVNFKKADIKIEIDTSGGPEECYQIFNHPYQQLRGRSGATHGFVVKPFSVDRDSLLAVRIYKDKVLKESYESFQEFWDKYGD